MFSLQEHLTWASNLTATHFKNQIVVRGKVRQPATFDNRFGHREGAHELTVPVLVLRPPSAPSRPLWSTTRIGSVFLDSFVITFTQLKRYAGPAQGAIRTIAEYLNRVNKWAPGCVSGYRLLVQIADRQASQPRQRRQRLRRLWDSHTRAVPLVDQQWLHRAPPRPSAQDPGRLERLERAPLMRLAASIINIRRHLNDTVVSLSTVERCQ